MALVQVTQVRCVTLLLPVQTAVLTNIRVRSAELGAAQQAHSILAVQRQQWVTASNQRSEVTRRRELQKTGTLWSNKMKNI